MHSLVTGGAQGIGRAIVELLHARKDIVYVFDKIPSSDPSVITLVEKGIWYATVDVSSAVSVKEGYGHLFAHQKAHGIATPTLDLLVNNAGITCDGLALRMSERDWDAVLDVNAKGAFLCAQQALAVMIRQQKSYIINLSSVVGLFGNAGQVNYAASKAAVIGLTKSLAQEYAKRNVLVNAIAPGLIRTAMTDNMSDSVKLNALGRIPLGRFGNVQDIAHLVDFLSSGNADYITGQVLSVNGGMR